MKLKINDKEYGLQWGLGCFEICCDRLEKDLSAIDYGVAIGDQKTLFNLVYSAMQNYAELEDSELDISYRKFQAWLDDAPQETAQHIMEDYMKSKYMGKTMQQHYDSIVEDQVNSKPKKK